MITPEELMRAALDKTRQGLRQGHSPFGCAIALDGQIVACEHNTVVATPDSTAHAEVNAIRNACRTLGRHLLEGAVVAATCEPCAMCMAALHWARVSTVHFGATVEDAAAAGFNELHITAAELLRISRSPVQLHAGLLRAECRQLFDQWLQAEDRTAY